MEQLVIVLIIGAVSLIRWVMEKSAEARAERESAERRENPSLDEAEAPPVLRPAHPMHAPRPIAFPLPDPDAAARRLRKALGLPDEAELPPPIEVERETLEPRKPVILFERPLPEFVPRRFSSPLEIVEEGPPPVPAPAPPLVTAPPAKPARLTGLEELLRTREGLRKAILVQEILGTPKGLVF